jgi:hypothetical protein
MKKYLFCFFFSIAVFAAVGQRDTSRGNAKLRDDIARGKLQNFVVKLNESNVRNFGFSSLQELKSSALSNPFAIAIISLDKLKNYTSNTDVNSLIIQTPRYIYPIINKNNSEVINAMMVDNPTGREWSLVSMGRSKDLAKAIYLQNKERPDNYFISSMPSFGLYFISFYSNNILMMIPITSDPQNKVEAGRAQPAQHIFAAYVPVARRYNGLPM